MGTCNPTDCRTSYTVSTGPEPSDKLIIQITEPVLSAQGLSLTTWAGASILASLVHRLSGDAVRFPPVDKMMSEGTIPILELGAGTGMVGISSAVRWRLPALLTDLAPIVPGIAANITLNRDILSGSHVAAGSLDWYHPSELQITEPTANNNDSLKKRFPFASASKAQLILAADTVYSEEHPRLLASTIPHWLSRDGGRAIICYPLRVAYLDEIRELWSRFEEAGLECLQEGKEDADSTLFDDETLCEWSIWRLKGCP